MWTNDGTLLIGATSPTLDRVDTRGCQLEDTGLIANFSKSKKVSIKVKYWHFLPEFSVQVKELLKMYFLHD
jgi:hypothetical protein